VIQVVMNHVKLLELIVHTDAELIVKVIVLLHVWISAVVIVEIHAIHIVFLDVNQVVNLVAMLHVILPLTRKTEVLHKINKGEKTWH